MLLNELEEQEHDLHLAVNFELSFHVVYASLNPDGSLRFRHDGVLHDQDVSLHEAHWEPAWQLPGGRNHDDVCVPLRHGRTKCTVLDSAWLQKIGEL